MAATPAPSVVANRKLRRKKNIKGPVKKRLDTSNFGPNSCPRVPDPPKFRAGWIGELRLMPSGRKIRCFLMKNAEKKSENSSEICQKLIKKHVFRKKKIILGPWESF